MPVAGSRRIRVMASTTSSGSRIWWWVGGGEEEKGELPRCERWSSAFVFGPLERAGSIRDYIGCDQIATEAAAIASARSREHAPLPERLRRQ